MDELLRELRENQETIITYCPVPQGGAKDPRGKVTISGPERLVDALYEAMSNAYMEGG